MTRPPEVLSVLFAKEVPAWKRTTSDRVSNETPFPKSSSSVEKRCR
jgi:hypothetical protein